MPMHALYLHLRGRGPVPNPYVSRQNPDATFLMTLVVLSGIGQLATNSPPPSVQAKMGDLYSVIWASGLIIFGLMCLLGMFMPEGVRALQVEQSGRFAMACLSLSYVLIALSVAGTSGIGVGFIVLAFSCACFIRVWIIHVWFKFLRLGGESA